MNAQRVDHAQPVWPVPGEWAPAVGGLTVTATAEDGVVVDGVAVDGTVLVAGDDAVGPVDGRIPRRSRRHGLPRHVARVGPASKRSAVSPGSRAFDRSEPPGSPPAGNVPVDGLEARGSVVDAAGDPLEVAGHIETAFGTTTDRLVAVRSAVHDGSARLQLIVQDATSALPEDDAGSTYSMGRFLYLDDPGAAAESSSTGTWRCCRRARSPTSSPARSHPNRTASRYRSQRGSATRSTPRGAVLH